MLKFAFAFVALSFSLATAARADVTYPLNPLPFNVCILTTAAVTPCNTNGVVPTMLVDVENLYAQAQNVTVRCWDNPTLASGQVVLDLPLAGATQIVNYAQPGKRLLSGLTCQASGVPLGFGIALGIR